MRWSRARKVVSCKHSNVWLFKPCDKPPLVEPICTHTPIDHVHLNTVGTAPGNSRQEYNSGKGARKVQVYRFTIVLWLCVHLLISMILVVSPLWGLFSSIQSFYIKSAIFIDTLLICKILSSQFYRLIISTFYFYQLINFFSLW